jgi:hypothetical protein
LYYAVEHPCFTAAQAPADKPSDLAGLGLVLLEQLTCFQLKKISYSRKQQCFEIDINSSKYHMDEGGSGFLITKGYWLKLKKALKLKTGYHTLRNSFI